MSPFEIAFIVLAVWFVCAWLFSHGIAIGDPDSEAHFKTVVTFLLSPLMLVLFAVLWLYDVAWPPFARYVVRCGRNFASYWTAG